MHDPMTEAFRFRSIGLTIWHVDPEKRGDDDSCDWFGHSRPLSEKERALAEAVENMESTLDNRPFYPDSPAHLEFQELKAAVRRWRQRSKWRIPVRWHFWHWRISVDLLRDLKRWLFSRCQHCGRRFTWGYAPISYSWNGTGPRWFRGEEHVAHLECDRGDPSAKMPQVQA